MRCCQNCGDMYARCFARFVPQRLAASWGRVVPVETCDGMAEAVAKAAACVAGGGTVLLSPACASQDMFTDYVHRGACFAEAVNSVLPA